MDTSEGYAHTKNFPGVGSSLKIILRGLNKFSRSSGWNLSAGHRSWLGSNHRLLYLGEMLDEKSPGYKHVIS